MTATAVRRMLGPLCEPLDEPLGFEAGDANLTRYVGNEPLKRVDPSGLIWAGVVVGEFEIPNVEIDGSSIKDPIERAKWEKQVLDDLKRIFDLKPLGEDLCIDIALGKAKKVIIAPRQPEMKDNLSRWPKGEDPSKVPTDVKIFYDPFDPKGGIDERGGDRRPPYIGLAHELDHARRIINGKCDLTLDPVLGKVTRDEITAIEFENKIRDAHNKENPRDRVPRRPRPRF